MRALPTMNPNLARSPGAGDSRSLATLRIDVIADFVCPWSWLGKRRLDDALLAVCGPSHMSWYPFRVNPRLPGEGLSFTKYAASRLADPEQLDARLAELALVGKAEGIEFRFDRLRAVPDTVDAHRLLKLAEAEGANVSGVAEGLFRGYFEESLDLAERDTLLELGRRGGLSAVSIRRALDDDSTRRAVLSQEARIRSGGITGVPNFLINRRLFVIGAQSTEALVNVFDRAMFGEESDRPVSSVLH